LEERGGGCFSGKSGGGRRPLEREMSEKQVSRVEGPFQESGYAERKGEKKKNGACVKKEGSLIQKKREENVQRSINAKARATSHRGKGEIPNKEIDDRGWVMTGEGIHHKKKEKRTQKKAGKEGRAG